MTKSKKSSSIMTCMPCYSKRKIFNYIKLTTCWYWIHISRKGKKENKRHDSGDLRWGGCTEGRAGCGAENTGQRERSFHFVMFYFLKFYTNWPNVDGLI